MKKVHFSLQVFCDDGDEGFVKRIGAAAKSLLETAIAPHIDWQITILKTSEGTQRPAHQCGGRAFIFYPDYHEFEDSPRWHQWYKRMLRWEWSLISSPG